MDRGDGLKNDSDKGAYHFYGLSASPQAALAWILPGAAWSDDFYSSTRKPFGIYAHIDFESVLPEIIQRSPSIQISQTPNQSCAVVTASPTDLAALHVSLQNFYTTLLSDEAVSGITMGMHWCRVQVQEPNKANSVCSVRSREWPCYPDGNDWSYVDDLFTAVHKYNAANKATKTIHQEDCDAWRLFSIPADGWLNFEVLGGWGFHPSIRHPRFPTAEW